MRFGAPVPILRSFDEARARAFWAGYLGFTVDWEHRFEPALPLYMQIRRGACVLHLSEHHGDGTPGGRLRIEVDDLDALQAELAAKPYRFAQPEIVQQPWGARELAIADPFGAVIIFWQAAEDSVARVSPGGVA